jgi:alanine racemase
VRTEAAARYNALVSIPSIELISTNTRPTWAEVDLAALRYNYRALAAHVAPRAVCAVVKCDAYGHGAVECARALEAEGAQWFGVTNPSEALVLRRAGIRARIFVLSGFWRGEEESIFEHDLTTPVWTAEHVQAMEAAAKRAGRSAVPVHLKIDTGMSRLGVQLNELPALLEEFAKAPRLSIEGVWSHLASSEVVDSPYLQAQIACFERGLALLAEKGIRPKYRHLANSAAIASQPSAWYDMVRPGVLLYGHYLPLHQAGQSRPEIPFPFEAKPVLSWKTRIIDLRRVPAGQGVGYGSTFTSAKPSLLATIPVGYGDGYLRALSNRGRVLVRGEYAPIAGNVSMDLTILDVSHIAGVAIGDLVTLAGSEGGKEITVEELAQHYRTISYEVLCGITKRVPRRYSGEAR